MFKGRFSSSMGLVGVDVGTRGVKMLQVREHAGRLQVVGAARVDVAPVRVGPPARNAERTLPTSAAAPGPSDEAVSPGEPAAVSVNGPDSNAAHLSDKIRAAFAAGGFTGRRCVVSLARGDVCVQSIRMPKMPDEELRQSAVWEASQRFGFDRQAMEVDFIRTGATLASGENRDEGILVAASHAAVHARLEPLLAAGLRPVAVDTAFAALVRTFSRQVRRESDRCIVRTVVDIGASGSTVLILRGDQIAFCKPLAISGEQFNQAVAEHLQIDERSAAELRQVRIASKAHINKSTGQQVNIDPPCVDLLTCRPVDLSFDSATDRAVYAAVRPLMGELVKEITLCLRYYGVTFRGHPPEGIILTGGDGLEPNLSAIIAKTCKLPVSVDDGSDTLVVGGAGLIGQIQTTLGRTPGPASCWAAALGLSLRGIGSKKSEGVAKLATQPAEGMRGAA